ncbi:MAG: hypothetical protein ABIA21_02765 [Candidatus Aenigmatarchaeota archaeon]
MVESDDAKWGDGYSAMKDEYIKTATPLLFIEYLYDNLEKQGITAEEILCKAGELRYLECIRPDIPDLSDIATSFVRHDNLMVEHVSEMYGKLYGEIEKLSRELPYSVSVFCNRIIDIHIPFSELAVFANSDGIIFLSPDSIEKAESARRSSDAINALFKFDISIDGIDIQRHVKLKKSPGSLRPYRLEFNDVESALSFAERIHEIGKSYQIVENLLYTGRKRELGDRSVLE